MVQDKEDIRLGKLVSPTSDADILCTLQGYPDDEGIRVNQGRPGAFEAPKTIREILFKMTPEISWPVHSFIHDAGDLRPESKSLITKQLEARTKTASHFKNSSSFLISLGGGHDYGFPDTAGFLDSLKDSKIKPLVINFDAHMDVRPSLNGPTSGTPFRQLLNEFGAGFEFIEAGIQPHCNSFHHLEWARAHKAKIVSLDEIRKTSLLTNFKKILKPNKKRPVFLSLDIDAFCTSLAPGCSASWPGGLRWEELLPAWQWLLQNFKVKGMGIYEVSPGLDLNSQTSRLAARMIYESLRQILPKNSALARAPKKR